MTGRHVDASARTYLAVCDACPSWRALRFDRAAAWSAAGEHEEQVHPGDHDTRDIARRHAGGSSTSSTSSDGAHNRRAW